jgi:hypothetical protein
MEPPIEFEKVSFDEAKKALETKVADDKVKGYHGERAPERGDPLLESTKRWLNELPARCVRPRRPGIFRESPTSWPSCGSARRAATSISDAAARQARGSQGISAGRRLELGTLSELLREAAPVQALDLGRRAEVARRRVSLRSTRATRPVLA